MADKLTAKQLRFVQEYLLDLNATAAYKRAGYAGKGNVAEASASRLLSTVKVRNAIQAAMDARAEDTKVNSKYVLTTIVDTIERCKQASPVLDRKGKPVFVTTPTGDIAPAYTFEAQAVLKGAELLGRHLKLFTDKVAIGGDPDAPPIQHNLKGLTAAELAQLEMLAAKAAVGVAAG